MNSRVSCKKPRQNSCIPSERSPRSSKSPLRSTVHALPASQIDNNSPSTMHNMNAEVAATKPTNKVRKRAWSAVSHSTDRLVQGNSTEDDTEWALQRKAKRLTRFKVGPSQLVQSSPDIANQRISANGGDMSVAEKQNLTGGGSHSVDLSGSFSTGNALVDHEGLEPPSVMVGLCPDMCPESERAERERRGDLHQYERLDGNINQTSKCLAVKKYNRAAKGEADLIRPIPVLQLTIDYLLSLLNEPYDDRFLGIYNFLWDRMRAIRMDLRMQCIFDLQAIRMLEQMIRLHIIAMHELCECTKGEGFSEGFDALLNIEQMNKASVELFQMYDDHRKKGIIVPTEKEFRGYYALLKLDKHPVYKVEPAELSLDLAKMTPEMRRTPEIIFARDAARACRTSNYVAFFRLVKKATYLQASLMHAHFAKLRTKALACLHSSLQKKQGLPVADVARRFSMEEEDIESIICYHGFGIKEFEEPYMLKEGPFLNADKDYPTKCSKLVHLKKSRTIVEDVACFCQPTSSPSAEAKGLQLSNDHNSEPLVIASVIQSNYAPATDEEIPECEAVPSTKDDMPVHHLVLGPSTVSQPSEDGPRVSKVTPQACDTFPQKSPELQPTKVGEVEQPKFDVSFRNSLDETRQSQIEAMPSLVVSTPVMEESFTVTPFSPPVAIPLTLIMKEKEGEHTKIYQEVEADAEVSNQDEEVAEAKLKLILRIWRRRSSKQRKRQLAASAALDSLSVGPPIQHIEIESFPPVMQPIPYKRFHELIFHRGLMDRYQKQEQSWSRLNVSEVVADELSERNPDSGCLCWKIIVCSQMINPGGGNMDRKIHATHFPAGTWLLSKLLPNSEDDDLIISSPDMSMWKKWFPSESAINVTCCLSVVVEAQFDKIEETTLGASAVIFLVSENIPWEIQKGRLHNLLMALPSGSCLPLLILSSSCEKDASSTIIDRLGLNSIDRSRVSCIAMVCLHQEYTYGFFSDEKLRKGLRWLAKESPLPPILRKVKTYELVRSHISGCLEVLKNKSIYEVGPDQCISAFNDALDQVERDICGAVDANRSGWPCPEIYSLLEAPACNEQKVIGWYLPSAGWSSAASIEPLVSAIRGCKLPKFPDDITWLKRGIRGSSSRRREELENQKSLLEDCLMRYLTEVSEVMYWADAKRVVHSMVQYDTTLETGSDHSTCYIVPKWVMIFQRVLNWQLGRIPTRSDPIVTAFVLESAADAAAARIESEYSLLRKKYGLRELTIPLDECIILSTTPPPPLPRMVL